MTKMKFSGTLNGNKYRTAITEEGVVFEYVKGPAKGFKAESDWNSIVNNYMEVVEVLDLRIIGWISLMVTILMIFVPSSHGRLDVVLLFSPPFALLSIFYLSRGKETLRNTVFWTTDGKEAFIIPTSELEKPNVKEFIQIKTGGNNNLDTDRGVLAG